MNRKHKTLVAFIIAVFMVSIFGCNSCPKPPGQPAAEEDVSKRPHKAFVEQALKKPLEARVKEYLELAKRLETEYPYKVSGAYPLTKEIVAQQDFEGLELLEERLENIPIKKAVWEAVRPTRGEKAQALLKKWALVHPDRYELMRYHPDGPDLLISKLEDTTAPPLTRYICARIISDMKLINLLPRLRKFADDKTPVPVDNAAWPCTLGGSVRECIQYLEIISKDPEERKPIELLKLGEGRVSYYKVWIYKEAPQRFTAGDTINISGKGIESARVHGSAEKERNGAWRVKEFDENHVVFEVTRDARVEHSLVILEVTAPNATEGKVRWEFKGKHAGTCTGEVYGPASVEK